MTTPNFGWPLIQPTDFVTDLPADFEAFADAVDADLDGLNGGTIGQVLTKASATDYDFAFANPAGGGAFTLLTTTNITAVNTISITAINQTFKHLFVTMSDFTTNNAGDIIELNLKTATSAFITTQFVEMAYNGTTPLPAANFHGGQSSIARDINSSVAAGANVNGTSFFIYNYAQTFQKSIVGSYGVFGVFNGNFRAALFGGSTHGSNGALAVHELSFRTQSIQNFRATGTIRIFGVN